MSWSAYFLRLAESTGDGGSEAILGALPSAINKWRDEDPFIVSGARVASFVWALRDLRDRSEGINQTGAI